MANGLIAGAFKGLADAAGGLAQGYIDDERRMSLEQQRSAIEEQRQMRIEQFRQKMGLETRQKEFDQDMANAPRRTEAANAAARSQGLVKSELDIEDTKRRGNDPAYLKARKAEVEASRGDPRYSPSELANAEMTRMKVADEKRRRQLLEQRVEVEQGSLRGDQRERAIKRIDRELESLAGAVIGGKKPLEETDTEKVTEKRYDEMGNVVEQRERTEKRRAPPSTSRAPKKEGEREAHEEARAAIARGASRDKVNARLQELGFSPL